MYVSRFLGKPWLYDLDVIHYGRCNTYVFKHDGKKIVLNPSKPSEPNNENKVEFKSKPQA